jgi:type IV pilus assembly protein PilN
MKIALNLATRPFADLGPALKRLRIAMAVLALAAIGMGVGLHALHNEAEAARERDQSLDGQIAHVQHERQSYQAMMQQPQNAKVLMQAERLNQLIDEKAFSWTLAIEDLETVLPGGVQVTTLEPERDKNGRITLQLRVLGPRDRAIEMVRNLEHSKHFAQPRIVGESSESQGGPNQRLEPVSASSRVNLDVEAEYIPPTVDEEKSDKAGKKEDAKESAKATEPAKGGRR